MLHPTHNPDLSIQARDGENPITHRLKTWSRFFHLSLSGLKTFEVRKFDRDYRISDWVTLFEFYPESKTFSGNHLHAMIFDIIRDCPGIYPDFCILVIVFFKDNFKTKFFPKER